MHNVFVNQRALARHEKQHVSLDAEGEGHEAWQIPVRADAVHARRADRADAACRPLPVDQREVLLLAVVEELRYEEIAAVLGIPVGTVMSRLSRAREKLRACVPPTASRNERLRQLKIRRISRGAQRSDADPLADHRRRRQRLCRRPARARARAGDRGSAGARSCAGGARCGSARQNAALHDAFDPWLAERAAGAAHRRGGRPGRAPRAPDAGGSALAAAAAIAGRRRRPRLVRPRIRPATRRHADHVCAAGRAHARPLRVGREPPRRDLGGRREAAGQLAIEAPGFGVRRPISIRSASRSSAAGWSPATRCRRRCSSTRMPTSSG